MAKARWGVTQRSVNGTAESLSSFFRCCAATDDEQLQTRLTVTNKRTNKYGKEQVEVEVVLLLFMMIVLGSFFLLLAVTCQEERASKSSSSRRPESMKLELVPIRLQYLTG